MTIRQCVTYSNDLRGTLTSRSNNVVSSNKGILIADTCIYIPNIVDLSQNTKMLWPGQEKNTILKTII
jgi:hypothetical protein